MAAQKWQADSVGRQVQVRARGDHDWLTIRIGQEEWTSFWMGGRAFSAQEDRPGHVCISTAIESGDPSVGLLLPDPENSRGRRARLVDINFYIRLPQ